MLAPTHLASPVLTIAPATPDKPSVVMAYESFRRSLLSMGFLLDGGGGFMLWGLDALNPIGFEVCLVVAVPAATTEPPEFRIERLVLTEGDDALLALACPMPEIGGQQPLMVTTLDLGCEDARGIIRQLASQERTRVLRVHPHTGALIHQSAAEMPDAGHDLEETLRMTANALPMSPRRKAELHDRAMSHLTAYPSAPRVARNQPCPCGSGTKAKRCCHA